MRKALFISLLLVSAVGCSQMPATKRAPSSTENCNIVSDTSGKQYKVEVNGQPYGKKWYPKHEAEKLMTRYQQSGTCY